MVVFAVGLRRLDKLFGSLDERQNSANWLMGKVWGDSYCGAGSIKVIV